MKRASKAFYTDVGHRLHQARMAKGWSLATLARKASSSPQGICGYEAGRCLPNGDTLYNLCTALGVSADWILGLKEKEA